MTKNEKMFLHQEISVLKRYGRLNDVPDFIENNLADHIELREYQKDAFQYFITYYETEELSKNKQIQSAFQMATGSGKTVIMAGLILYLYQKGYRNFVFFVNQTTIIEKTKENFINNVSDKYLFSDNILIDGLPVSIKTVDTFSNVPEDTQDIHIVFTSIQGLYERIRYPRENIFSIKDFEDNKVVMLADENHHGNRRTKGDQDGKGNGIETWEDAVNTAYYANRDNILLEFSATLGISTNKNIREKYMDSLVFNYDLSKFRESGYTKDFQNFATDTDLWTRALIAIVMSEYRRHLFGDLKINQKPVLMFKSRRIQDSADFYVEFFAHMKKLSLTDLEMLYGYQPILDTALDYFKNKGNGLLTNLHSFLKTGFTEGEAIIVDNKNQAESNQIMLNTLESIDTNPYRLIFAVDMLNEGWDVLNLYDIVRLYDSRQGSGVAGEVGAYTIKEAQLIGRGARYNPFISENNQVKDKRKYDSDLDNPYRILETMYFHSKNDSRYIAELRQALKKIGLEPDEQIILHYELKEDFKDTPLYKTGLVYSNSRIVKSRQKVSGIEGSLKTKSYIHSQPNKHGSLINLFGEDKINRQSRDLVSFKYKEIPYHILEGASMRYPSLGFNSIKSKYPNVNSLEEFLTSENYLGNRTLEIKYEENYTSRDLYQGLIRALSDVSSHITQFKEEYEGTTEFTAKEINKIVKNKSIKLSRIHEDGLGTSQNEHNNDKYQLDLTQEDWYIFTDNYGTTEEKLFLKYFKSHIHPILKEKDVEYYVVRNERFPELSIYSFDDGERFEPDFLLFIRKIKHIHDNYQVFIEPKGNHLLLNDKWKENLLLELEEKATLDEKYQFTNNYCVLGLPFYNELNTKIKFEGAIKKIIDNI